MVERTFDELVGEAATAPIHGWDFAWLEGRATEERPTWRYSTLVAERIESSSRMLDLDCGGAEMLGELPAFPQLLVATEGWMPNATIAAKTLSTRGGHLVVAAGDSPVLPFADGSYDLVTSRHPVRTWWHEVARVLIPDGTFLSQQVGPGTVRELREFMMGPQPRGSSREPQLAKALLRTRAWKCWTSVRSACARCSETSEPSCISCDWSCGSCPTSAWRDIANAFSHFTITSGTKVRSSPTRLDSSSRLGDVARTVTGPQVSAGASTPILGGRKRSVSLL